jgi:mannitol/fructose-specific phosphotransferase system IIA component
MPDLQNFLMKTVPSVVPNELPVMSDDECLARLARAIAAQDSEHLDEVARLIGRLAVTIE